MTFLCIRQAPNTLSDSVDALMLPQVMAEYDLDLSKKSSQAKICQRARDDSPRGMNHRGLLPNTSAVALVLHNFNPNRHHRSHPFELVDHRRL